MNGTPDWLRPDPRDTNVFVWHFVPPRIEPFEPLRMQRYDTPPIADGQQSPIATTDSIHSRGDALLHLMTFECESRAAARAQLLHVLGGFQGPVLERSDVAGEVAFAAPGEISVAAVRGNLVLLAMNGGTDPIGMGPLVRGIDDRLARQPQNFDEKLDIKPLLAARRSVAATIDLRPPAAGAYVHIVAEGGEVHLVDGRPVYTATTPGRHRLTVAVVGAERVTGAQIDVNVE